MISRTTLWVLLAVFTIVWFSTLEYRRLIKPDEGRYAEIAREMALTGDWVTPRLNGIKYFEKPPLQYWATAAAFRLFGENEWTARLWSGLTGFLGVLLAWFTGRRLFGEREALIAATVLGTSLLYVLVGHLNTLDMGVTFFLQAGMCAFMLAQTARVGSREEHRWMLGVWAALALAMLSKGLVSFALPALALVAYSLLQRDLRPWKRLHLTSGVPLFLIISAPWFVAVSLANPEFPRFFFLHEHFERFLTSQHGRYQPPWYFVPILAVGLLPWTLLGAHALADACRHRGEGLFNAARFLLLWTVAIFVFFSVSGSKLPSYVLPVFPAIALLAGVTLARMPPEVLRWHILALAVIAIIATVLFPGVSDLADQETPVGMMERYAKWLTTAAAVFAAGTLLALWLNNRRRPLHALLALGVAALFLSETTLQGHEALGRSNSAYYISKEILPHLDDRVPVYSVGMYEQTLPFYLGRTVVLVEYGDEMAFGLAQEPHLAIPTVEEFKRIWLQGERAVAVMTETMYRRLASEGLPMRKIAQDTRRIAVARP